MKGLFVCLLMLVILSGCATVDRSIQLKTDATIDIVNVSDEIVFSSQIVKDANEADIISNRITRYTASYLRQYGIKYNNDVDSFDDDNPTVEIEVSSILADKERSHLFFTKAVPQVYYSYRIISNNQVIFEDRDEKDADNIEIVCDAIAKRIAKHVKRSFVDPSGV